MKDKLLFLSHFIRNPKEVGAISPSSIFLTNEIIKNIDFEKSKNIVELGSGLGAFTKVILKKSKPSARLLCFEVNEKFCEYLNNRIKDKRLTIVRTCAEDVNKSLKMLGMHEADCVVSGLPFRNFSDAKKMKILKEVRNSLSDNGTFILFQYTNGLSKMLESCFAKVERAFVPLNIPPAFVYKCEK